MDSFFKYNKNKFHIVSVKELSETTIDRFLSIILSSDKAIKKNKYPLGGRAQIVIKNFPETGMIVFKNYLRGGLVRFFNKKYYLSFKEEIRPVQELVFLKKLRELNIPVPEPVAAYYKGKYVYQGGIITKYITSPYNLAEYSLKNQEKAEMIFKEKFLPAFEKMVENKIYHSDLHPGNVVVSNEEDISIIDFDKSDFFDGLPFYLREKMQQRWNRGVMKHKLPSFLAIDQ